MLYIVFDLDQYHMKVKAIATGKMVAIRDEGSDGQLKSVFMEGFSIRASNVIL